MGTVKNNLGFCFVCFRKCFLEAGGLVVKNTRTLVVLAKDLVSVPITHNCVYITPVPGDPVPLLAPIGIRYTHGT